MTIRGYTRHASMNAGSSCWYCGQLGGETDWYPARKLRKKNPHVAAQEVRACRDCVQNLRRLVQFTLEERKSDARRFLCLRGELYRMIDLEGRSFGDIVAMCPVGTDTEQLRRLWQQQQDRTRIFTEESWND